MLCETLAWPGTEFAVGVACMQVELQAPQKLLLQFVPAPQTKRERVSAAPETSLFGHEVFLEHVKAQASVSCGSRN